MIYKKFADKKISLLGLGGMRFPVKDGKIDFEKTSALVGAAFDLGVNYFDTAWFYHGGESETVLGGILKSFPRKSFYLADKMPPWEIKAEADIERIFNEQLRRAGAGYFDFYLSHGLNAASLGIYEKFPIYQFLLKKKREGLIKHLGFSFHDNAAALQRILERYDYEFVQLQVNYFDWDYSDAKGQVETAVKHKLPIIVMEPVRGGLLAGLPEEAAAVLLAADKNASAASWAIRYAAGLPNVLTVLSGMSDTAQLRDNAAAVARPPLTAKERKTLEKAAEIFRRHKLISCTACGYCKVCERAVDIPKLIRIYNDYSLSKWAGSFIQAYKDEKDKTCTSCGRCAKRCPQKLDIPGILKQIAALYIKETM